MYKLCLLYWELQQTLDSYEEFVFQNVQISFFKYENVGINNCFCFPSQFHVKFQMNIPAIGFAPYVNTTAVPHDHNEFLNADIYSFGIEIYKKIIADLASV